MSSSKPPKAPQENLERIAQILERIEKHLAPPPLWQRTLSFGFNHFAMIVGMIVLIFFLWQIWGYVSVIMMQVDSIRSGFEMVTGSVGSHIPDLPESLKSFQFWGGKE